MQPVLSIVMPFDNKREVELALAALTVIDFHEIEEYRLPLLYLSGVRYQRDPCLVSAAQQTCNQFLTARQALAKGATACGPLAAWRTAELWRQGDKRARAFCISSPGIGWHCRVRHGDGTIEDPSVRLGMGADDL